MKFNTAVVGGTFDHLHEGHKDLLKMCFDHSKYVDIGLTTEQMIFDKGFTSLLLSFEEREHEVREFLHQESIDSDRFKIVPLLDIFGNTLEKDFDAIFVTEHTKAGAEIINTQREKKNKEKLDVMICPLRKDTIGIVLCSSRIREGVVNRTGFAYETLFNKAISLTETQKLQLKDPLGDLTDQLEHVEKKDARTVIVGDVTLEKFLNMGNIFDFAYIDRRSMREDYIPELKGLSNRQLTHMTNTAGSISSEIVEHIKEHIQTVDQTVFEIQGEEDLLVLPLILLLPLESKIFYGQPARGVVEVRVTEEKKELVKSLLENA